MKSLNARKTLIPYHKQLSEALEEPSGLAGMHYTHMWLGVVGYSIVDEHPGYAVVNVAVGPDTALEKLQTFGMTENSQVDRHPELCDYRTRL